MEMIFWPLIALALVVVYFGVEVVGLLKSIREDVRGILKEIQNKLDSEERAASIEAKAKYQEQRQATIAAQRRDARRG